MSAQKLTEIDWAGMTLSIPFATLWIASASDLRRLIEPETLALSLIHGSAPSFFAAITTAVWCAYVNRPVYPWVAGVLGALVSASAEIPQIFMRNTYPDLNDVAAAVAGGIAGSLIVSAFERMREPGR